MPYGVTSSIVYGVTYLIYGFGLDYKDFSSILYGVAYPNVDYGYTLIYRLTYSNIVYNTLPPNLVRGPSLVYITQLSYPPALKLPLLVYLYEYLVEYLCSPLVDLVLIHSATPKLLLLCLALDYTHVSILLVEDPILSYVILTMLYSEYKVSY